MGLVVDPMPRLRQHEGRSVSAISLSTSSQPVKGARLFFLPSVGGILAALAMVTIYLGILSILQSPAHAVEQLATDSIWIGLVALGFGTQVGLYIHLRVVIHAAKVASATVVTGAGTGTSTLGMLACCAHHLTDVAPLVGLAGASGLSGAIGFLTAWKYAFISLGLVMNAIGIIATVRTIRECKSHLNGMVESAVEGQAAPTCH